MRLTRCVAILCLASPASAAGQASTPACAADSAFHRLDFWLGQWVVKSRGVQVGTNHIERILDGCAVTEHWTSGDGSRGVSLFYYVPATRQWHQVWVTASATQPGGVKEKRLVAELPDGGLRFQGEIPLLGGGSYFDRTTLTPMSGGRVRQLIEVSRDGRVWRTTFDAMYEPAAEDAP